MNNLIKNELFKIFHKKFIYILAIICVALTCFIGFIVSTDFSVDISSLYKPAADTLESGDTKDLSEEDIAILVEEKSYYDALLLIKDKGYKSYSWQASYIEGGVVYENIKCLNRSKYISKDDAEYNKCKEEYDKNLKYLEDDDWKHFVNLRLEENKKQLSELEASLSMLSESEKAGVVSEYNMLKYTIEADEYRLKYNIADDGSANSALLNSYASVSYEWDETDKNEKNYKTQEALAEKRSKEKLYYETKYAIENGIFYKRTEGYGNSLTNFTESFGIPIFYLIILAIVLGATMVTEEFNKGTIKQLLLKPYTRTKLLFSKISAGFIVFVLFSLFYILFYYVVSGCFLGFKDLQLPMIVYNFSSHKVVEYNSIVYALLNFISTLPAYFMLFSLAFVMGILFENSIIAIIVPLILYMFGDLVALLIPKSLAKLSALLPTNCWNLNDFLFGGISSANHVTFTKSLIVDIVFVLICVVVSVIFFKRKDIKNQ